MIDQIIIDAVVKDEKALGVSSLRPNYILMTGMWRMVDDPDGVLHILCTDDFRNIDEAMDVIVAPDCEVVDGERLVMYTSVLLDTAEFSLVLIKSKVWVEQPEDGGSDAPDVG